MVEKAESGTEAEPPSQALEEVRKALRGLRLGQVTVFVQDGVVVQVERLERVRITRRLAKR